jgi:hypothetical protein
MLRLRAEHAAGIHHAELHLHSCTKQRTNKHALAHAPACQVIVNLQRPDALESLPQRGTGITRVVKAGGVQVLGRQAGRLVGAAAERHKQQGMKSQDMKYVQATQVEHCCTIAAAAMQTRAVPI